jgi:HAD superfamily hydrolase (TIGR01509 family)
MMPGALNLLRDLQSNGVRTALVSASPRNIVDAVLDNLGHDLFPFSISSDDVNQTKPHPECYVKAAELSGVEISNCLIFEDSLTGMNAAISSGAYLIGVPHLVSIEESEKVRVIKSLEQLNYRKIKQLREDFSISI